MSDPRPGNFAHLPFLPAGLPPPYTQRPLFGPVTNGSFVQGRIEESFMKYIWRVRSWTIYTGAPVRFHNGLGDSHITLNSAPGDYIMTMGYHLPNVTGAYADLDDILCRFRPSQSQFLGPLISPSYHSHLTVDFGASGDYTGNDIFNIMSSQLKVDDSEVLDLQNQLTTNSDLESPNPMLAAGVELHFDPDGDNIIRTMFQTDLTSAGLGSASWSGGPIYVKPHEYWTWGGRFDATTGAVVGDNVTQYMCQN